MTSQKEKKAMREYINGLFEENPNTRILYSNDDILEIEDLVQEKKAGVFLHNKKTTKKDFKKLIKKYDNFNQGLINIFYKDYINFFVRLAQGPKKRSESWRQDKSLKNYSQNQINRMLHLRDLEKLTLQHWGNPLAFYQPKTDSLEEGLRLFEMENVVFDYTHLTSEERWRIGRLEQQTSEVYFIPNEIAYIDPGKDFALEFAEKFGYKQFPKIVPAKN